MTVAEVVHRPLHFVWPLLFSKLFSRKIVKAREFAQEVGKAGELRILPDLEQHVGYVSLLVYLPEKDGGCSTGNMEWWTINIRPVHFGGYDAKVFDFNALRHIEFKYRPEGVTVETAIRYPWDPSSYLIIVSVR